jgi:hypothetical protein
MAGPRTQPTRGDPAAVPVSERICAGACLAFAWWTLCAHAVVAAGGSLVALIALFAATGAGMLGAARWRRRRRGAGAPAPGSNAEARAPVGAAPTGPADPVAAGRDRPRLIRLARRGTPFLAVAAAAAAWGWDDPIAWWVLLLAALAPAALVVLAVEATRADPPRLSRAAERGLLLLAIACAAYALVVHRVDTDDAFYVDMAVSAIDLPELPLLARDTLHGRFDLPIHYPSYRLHAYELGNAAVALITGIPAIYVFHWLAAALAAALVVLAHAALFRTLTPHCWPWTTLALVVVLISAGEVHRWYGNFAFVRIWQGKAICLFVFVPLVYAYALRFAQRGGARDWLLLAAAQIAAVGASATAVWAAPIAALTAIASALHPGRAGLRRLGIGALASAYVVAAGLLVKGGMAASLAAEPEKAFAAGSQLGAALHIALGKGRLYGVGVVAPFVAWVCCAPGSLGRRFAIAVPLGVTAVLLCPWADALVRENVTGPAYWRAMWALPVPILLALIAVTPLARPGAADRAAGRAACLALVAAFALLVPRYPGWSTRNRAWVGWPALKVDPGYPFSVALNELAPRQRVVAPWSVSTWVPVSHDHAYPMSVRFHLRPQRERIGEREYRDRILMTRFAGGEDARPRAAAAFERGLELYGVEAACIRNAETLGAARDILRRAGFVKRLQGTDMEIWVRGERPAPDPP